MSNVYEDAPAAMAKKAAALRATLPDVTSRPHEHEAFVELCDSQDRDRWLAMRRSGIGGVMDLSDDELRRFRFYASELPADLGDRVRHLIDAEIQARAVAPSSNMVVCPECAGMNDACTLCGGTGEVDREVAEIERAA